MCNTFDMHLALFLAANCFHFPHFPHRPRFGTTGPSSSRIDRLIASPTCRCHRGSCYLKLKSVKDGLLQLLRIFWAFPKNVQDLYLRQIGGKGKTWFLLGKKMGMKCVVATLGVGNARFARVGDGRMDRRLKKSGFAPRLYDCVKFVSHWS